MPIKHVVVLMLENRSFDCMLGMLYPKSAGFDGLDGTEANTWHKPGNQLQVVPVWKSPELTPTAACIPNPDPGELFTDIDTHIHGLPTDRSVMGGFVDNYMRQKPGDPRTDPAPDPAAPMHYFTPDQLPVMSTLARSFAVSDRWHASAPCQTWPNRFFVHTGTANGYVDNAPTHFPYEMPTVFHRLNGVGASWRVYFHDIPQSATLAELWLDAITHFHDFSQFLADAKSGTLPAYSFIEPRYFTDTLLGKMPNDQHPPHNVSHGEALIAAVYDAVRGGPGWDDTLLIVTYDEHGGCYDHVVPPAAVPPDNRQPDGFAFGSYGVRVPALIVSRWVRPGSVIRPQEETPFDHTSILATLRKLFGFAPLTARDAAAPDLLFALDGDGSADCPQFGPTAEAVPSDAELALSAARPPNDLQHALNVAAVQLPTAGADPAMHAARLASTTDPTPTHPTVESAAAAILAHVGAFLGRF
jgi:phospholipase C